MNKIMRVYISDLTIQTLYLAMASLYLKKIVLNSRFRIGSLYLTILTFLLRILSELAIARKKS